MISRSVARRAVDIAVRVDQDRPVSSRRAIVVELDRCLTQLLARVVINAGRHCERAAPIGGQGLIHRCHVVEVVGATCEEVKFHGYFTGEWAASQMMNCQNTVTTTPPAINVTT